MRCILVWLSPVLAAGLVNHAQVASRAAAPGAAPAADAKPPTQAEVVGKMKKDMHEKLGEPNDADYVIDRPTKVPPSTAKAKAVPPGPYNDIAHDDGAPGPAPAAAAPGMPATIASLHPTLQHKNKETGLDDWRVEYRAEGPALPVLPSEARWLPQGRVPCGCSTHGSERRGTRHRGGACGGRCLSDSLP